MEDIPFTWAVLSDGHHIRLGFEKHELDLSPSCKKILTDVETFFRLTAEPKIPSETELDISAVTPANAKGASTVKEFIRMRGFYKVKYKSAVERQREKALADLSESEFQRLMDLAKRDREDEDEFDAKEEENIATRLAELERRYNNDTEKASKRIAELESQLAQKETEAKELREKLQFQKTLLDNLSSLLNQNK